MSLSATQTAYQAVHPVWDGGAAYLVGGGPSLRSFPWEQLEGKHVVAINRAFQAVPTAAALYWNDFRFFHWFRREISAFDGMKVTCRPNKSYPSDVVVLRRIRSHAISMQPECIADANNSGYAAINLAVKLGARRVYLLGYDLRVTPASTHWHDGYPRRHNPGVFGKLHAHFAALAQELPRLGVEVWNANPSSLLRAFPKCTLESALEDCPSIRVG